MGFTREDLAKRTLFTTHTPVPAGHDRFDWEGVKSVIGTLLPEDSVELVKEAGDPENGERCSMSHLAFALSGSVNAVSHLNAKVASSMFAGQAVAPITNGIHHLTWTGSALSELFDEYLPGWRVDPLILQSANSIPDEALINSRNQARSELRTLVRESTGVELDEKRLTIGFARRFATYKRANLVFSDLERLREIGAKRIQFVFAGKAHPRDQGGKALIKSIFSW